MVGVLSSNFERWEISPFIKVVIEVLVDIFESPLFSTVFKLTSFWDLCLRIGDGCHVYGYEMKDGMQLRMIH